MKRDICIYCDEAQILVKWKETGEWVCYECRLQMLEQEFEDAEEIKES